MRVPGSATYAGDVRKDVVGKVMGPLTYGGYITAEEANYDEKTDRTTVFFHNTTVTDIEREIDGNRESDSKRSAWRQALTS